MTDPLTDSPIETHFPAITGLAPLAMSVVEELKSSFGN